MQLYYARARWYDSEMGRFASEDPARDGMNWYAYAGNNPMMFVDPSGLETEPVPDNKEQNKVDNENNYEFLDKYKESENYDLIKDLYIHYQVFKLSEKAQEKFVDLITGSTGDSYEPCTGFIVSSFKTTHDIDIIAEINKMEGTNMAEKAENYAEKTGKIQIITNGAEAQALANKAEDVGIIGHYFYKNNPKRFIHYGKVAPSAISYDEAGKPLKYKTKGTTVILNVLDDPNNPHNRWGPLVANKGATNGLVAYSWAFNQRPPGYQRDSNNNITGGIIFFRVVPETEQNSRSGDRTRNEEFSYTRGGYIMRPRRE